MNFELPLHIRQNLRSLGFSDHDMLILAYLFFKKKASLREISRQTVLSFSTCHYICTNLLSLGLLKMSKAKGTETYQICTQAQFLEWIDAQQKTSDQRYQSIKTDLSQFLSVFQESDWKPEVTYFEGVEGIREIYRDMLKTKHRICGWTDIALIQKTIGKKFMDEYIAKRIEHGIETLSIIPHNPVNVSYSGKDQKRKTKMVKNFPIPGEIRIYGDKVAIITFEKEQPVGIVMKGMLIHAIFQTVFDNAWKS